MKAWRSWKMAMVLTMGVLVDGAYRDVTVML